MFKIKQTCCAYEAHFGVKISWWMIFCGSESDLLADQTDRQPGFDVVRRWTVGCTGCLPWHPPGGLRPTILHSPTLERNNLLSTVRCLIAWHTVCWGWLHPGGLLSKLYIMVWYGGAEQDMVQSGV